MQPFHREPTFYTTTNSEQIGYNKPDREGVVLQDGTPVRVRHPQAGHQGDYDSVIRMQGEGYRWITVVKTDGSTVCYVLTNGAADMNPGSEYAQDRKQKARFYGWFRLGQCPVALLGAGEMHQGHFADRSLLKAQACQPGTHSLDKPCPHALAEIAARRAKHAARESESAEAFADKQAAAQRAQTEALTSAMAEQTNAIVGTLANALGGKSEDSKGKR